MKGLKPMVRLPVVCGLDLNEAISRSPGRTEDMTAKRPKSSGSTEGGDRNWAEPLQPDPVPIPKRCWCMPPAGRRF